MLRQPRNITVMILGMVLMCITPTTHAQVLLSRSALDSLVNPRLSGHSSGAITLSQREVALGEIDDNRNLDIEVTLRNTSQRELTITTLRSTCSCLVIKSEPCTLQPNESMPLRVSFNPTGRSNSFNVGVMIYTSLDTELPTERLTITGTVTASDRWAHYKERMGEVGMMTRNVTITDIKTGTTRQERIACVNSGDKPIRLTARSTIEGIELHTEPDVLQPESEGDIVISYRAPQGVTHDIETMLIVEGVAGSIAERMIRITIKR